MSLAPTLYAAAALALSLAPAASVRPAGACALVTRAEAASALGAAVPAGVEKAVGVPMPGGAVVQAQYCFYGSEVSVARLPLGASAKPYFAAYRKSLATRSDYQDVVGLGDEAFAAKGQLAVRRGETGVIVDVGQARGMIKGEAAAERGLAALALGRL